MICQKFLLASWAAGGPSSLACLPRAPFLFSFLAILQFSQAVLRRLSPYGIEIALSTLIFFVSDSDSSKLDRQQMVELKSGSTKLRELLSGNDAAENDDVDEHFEINVYGQR